MNEFVEFVGSEHFALFGVYEKQAEALHVIRREDVICLLTRPDGYWLNTKIGKFSLSPEARDELAEALL